MMDYYHDCSDCRYEFDCNADIECDGDCEACEYSLVSGYIIRQNARDFNMSLFRSFTKADVYTRMRL